MIRLARGFVFIWFLVGGVSHFLVPQFFLQIVPPALPLRYEAVILTGFLEVLGALGLLMPPYRRAAALGLMVLTVAVTPANIYMWLHPQLFPAIPEFLLTARLFLQVILLFILWVAARP